MDNSIPHYKPINVRCNKRNLPSFHQAVDCYDEGKYRESIAHTLKYIDPTISISAKGDLDMKIPHGSVVLTLKVTDSTYHIEAPFVKVPDTGSRIALMRQVAELNFSYLSLARIIMRGDELVFLYEDRIENSDPYKMYYVLEEICYGSDYYDDYFIDKFGTMRVTEPQLKYFSKSEKEDAHKEYIAILKAALADAEYFDAKRWYSNSCDVLCTAIMQVDYVVGPQGVLANQLSDVFNDMFKPGSAEEISLRTKQGIKKLLEYDRTKFDEALFFPKYLVPFKKYADLPFIQDYIGNTAKQVNDHFSGQNYLNATLSSLYIIYLMYWNYTLPENIESILEKALKKTSEKSFKDAGKTLRDALQEIVNMKVKG